MEKPPLAAAIATAVISTLAIAEVQAEVNPFATNAMPSGYMQLAADHDAAFAQHTRREDYKNQLARTAAGEERQRKANLLKERNQWMANYMDEQGIDPNDRSAVIQAMGRSPYASYQGIYAKIMQDPNNLNNRTALATQKAGIDERAATHTFNNTKELEKYKKDQIKTEANEAKQYLAANGIDFTNPENMNGLIASSNPILATLGKDWLNRTNEAKVKTTAYNREQDEKNRKTELDNKKLDDLAKYTLEQNVDYNDIDQATKQALSSTNPTIKQRALTKADKMVAAKEKERAHYSSEQTKSELTRMSGILNSAEDNVLELPSLVGFWTTDSTSNAMQLIPGSEAYNYQEKVNHINRQARNLGMMLARMNHKNTGMKEGEQLQALISALKDVGASEEEARDGIEKTLRLIDEAKQYKDYLLSLGERKKYDPSNPKGTFEFQNRFDINRDPEQAPAEGRKIMRDENGKPTHILFPNGRREELSQELRNIQ